MPRHSWCSPPMYNNIPRKQINLIHREGGKMEFDYCNPETSVEEIGRLIMNMKFGWDGEI